MSAAFIRAGSARRGRAPPAWPVDGARAGAPCIRHRRFGARVTDQGALAVDPPADAARHFARCEFFRSPCNQIAPRRLYGFKGKMPRTMSRSVRHLLQGRGAEQQLVEGLIRGEEASYRQLYEAFSPRLRVLLLFGSFTSAALRRPGSVPGRPRGRAGRRRRPRQPPCAAWPQRWA